MVHMTSIFDEDLICMKCQLAEANHTMQETAAREKQAAIRNGDLNFPGIGLPDDLIVYQDSVKPTEA